MSTTDSEPFDHLANDFARGFHVPHVSDGENQVRPDGSRGYGPFGSFGLQGQLGYLGDHVFAHTAEYQDVEAAVDFGLGKGTPKGTQTAYRKGGPLDPAQKSRTMGRMDVGKGLDVLGTGLATEQLRVALDPVEQRRGELGSELHPGGTDVLGENGRGGTVCRPDV